MCELIQKAGFPAGSINLISGYGKTVGAAIASHMDIDKVPNAGRSIYTLHLTSLRWHLPEAPLLVVQS